jgi:hypothetical protein
LLYRPSWKQSAGVFAEELCVVTKRLGEAELNGAVGQRRVGWAAIPALAESGYPEGIVNLEKAEDRPHGGSSLSEQVFLGDY